MLIAKQQSMFSGFAYDIFNDAGTLVGSMRWPNFAVATNARLQMPGEVTNIRFDYRGQNYEIDFSYLRRGWSNDIRFTLKAGAQILAQADVLRQKKLLSRPAIIITAPFSGTVVRKSSLLRTRYEVSANAVSAGTISEQSRLTLRRQLTIKLTDAIATPVQLFIFFLVCNHAYR